MIFKDFIKFVHYNFDASQKNLPPPKKNNSLKRIKKIIFYQHQNRTIKILTFSFIKYI